MVAELVLAFLCAQERSSPPGSPQSLKRERLYRRDLPDRRDPRLYLKRALRMGGGKDTEEALSSTLEELARTQEEDGSWSPPEGGSRLEVTSLALLSFLNAGYTVWEQQEILLRALAWRTGGQGAGVGPSPGYHRVLRRGMSYLWGLQLPDGFIGERDASHPFRDHAIATKVLCEVCCLGEDLLFRGPAERALEALVARPFPLTDADPEGVAWASLALRSAALGSLPFDRAVLDSLATNLRTSGDRIPRKRAVDLMLRDHLRDWRRLPADLRGTPPPPDLPSQDLRDWFWGSKALVSWRAPIWEHWNERMKPVLLEIKQGNAVTLTFRALTLEAYYGETWIYGLK